MTSPTTDTTPHISPAACAYLTVAAIAGTALAGIVFAEMATPFDVFRGVPATFAAVAAIAGIGYIVRTAEDRVANLVQRLERRLPDTDAIEAAERINLRLIKNQA